MRADTRERLRQAAVVGMEAHARLTTARLIRDAALTLRMLGEDKYAADLGRIARGLDAQRRKIMAMESR